MDLLWDLSLTFSKGRGGLDQWFSPSRIGGERWVIGKACIQTTQEHSQKIPAQLEKLEATSVWCFVPLT